MRTLWVIVRNMYVLQRIIAVSGYQKSLQFFDTVGWATGWASGL